ncbi:MAG: hypothetical protein ACOZCL_08525 [Bacillota bacterium]
MIEKRDFHRGEIYMADFTQYVAQGYSHEGMWAGRKFPIIIISNEMANKYSPIVSAIMLYDNINLFNNCYPYCSLFGEEWTDNKLPIMIEINEESGLTEKHYLQPSTTVANKWNLVEKLGMCTKETMRKIELSTFIDMGYIDRDTYNNYYYDILRKGMPINTALTILETMACKSEKFKQLFMKV